MPEILKNIKAEDRLKKIRIVSENDDVMGGQPEADGMKENDNNAIFDLACSVMHALAEVAKVDQKAIPQILDALGDSRTAAASQRIVNEVNKLAKAAQTAANQANDKANTAQSRADSAYNLGNTANNNANTRLEKSKNLSDLENTAVARNNLELGNSATLSTTSTLSDRTDQVATIKVVNDANRAASNAQTAANQANDKANAAQSRADSAYSLAASKRSWSDIGFERINITASNGFIDFGNKEDGVLSVAIANNRSSGDFYFYDKVSGRTIYLPISTESGTIATREHVDDRLKFKDYKNYYFNEDQRKMNIDYVNTTSYPILLTAYKTSNGSVVMLIDGIETFLSSGIDCDSSITVTIPVGSKYKFINRGGTSYVRQVIEYKKI